MNTFSQSVQSTVASVKAQMAASGTTHASSALLARHAKRHIGSGVRSLVVPVVEAVRDELYRERNGHGATL